MKLWRVDADFVVGNPTGVPGADGEVVGMITYFALSRVFDQRSDVLIGWSRDWYEIDVPELTREQAAALVARPWPTLPIIDLVLLATYKAPSMAQQAEVPLDEPVELDEEVELAVDPKTVAAERLQEVISNRDARAGMPATQRSDWEKE